MLDINEAFDPISVLRCDIGDETYALDMAWIHTIQRTDQLQFYKDAETFSTGEQKPRSANGKAPVGWIPSSDGKIPVFSLADRIGRSSTFSPHVMPTSGGPGSHRVIVLKPPAEIRRSPGKGDDRVWALLVDGVSQMVQVPSNCLLDLPPVVINPDEEYFRGLVHLEDESFLLIELEKLHPEATQDSASKGNANDRAVLSEPMRPMANLDVRRERVRSDHVIEHSGQGQIIHFSLEVRQENGKDISFGLSITQVPEILEPLPMISVPAAPDYVIGLLVWRGLPVPVIDLVLRMNMEKIVARSDRADTRLIVVRDKGYDSGSSKSERDMGNGKRKTDRGVLAAFLIQPSVQILNLPINNTACSRSIPVAASMNRGMVELEDETLIIPDLRAVLDPRISNERQATDRHTRE